MFLSLVISLRVFEAVLDYVWRRVIGLKRFEVGSILGGKLALYDKSSGVLKSTRQLFILLAY